MRITLKMIAVETANFGHETKKKTALPQGVENMKIDLMIQIGHNALQPSYLK